MRKVHSYSSLATLAACMQKYNYAYVEGLVPFEESRAQRAGTAIDAALNEIYTCGYFQTGLGKDAAIERLYDAWGDEPPGFGSKNSHLTPSFLEELLEVYLEDRTNNPTLLETGEVLTTFSGEQHEFEWEHPEYGTVTLRGIPDFVMKSGNKTYVVDLKCTTMWITDQWMHQFEIGHQLKLYAAMVEHMTGTQVSGGMINAIHMGPKGIDSPDGWKKRKSAPNALKRFFYERDQIEEVLEWAVMLRKFEALCEETNMWPRNEKACGLYAGCEYLSLCKAPNRNLRRGLYAQFDRKPCED